MSSLLCQWKNTGIIKSKLQKDEDCQILNWLTPLDCGTRHSDLLQKRQPGTCQWLLESKDFQNWLNTTQKTLFCPGIPGTGKSVLTSVVVDHLVSSFQDDETVCVAYIYLSFQRRKLHY